MRYVVLPRWARGPSAVALALLISVLPLGAQIGPQMVPVFPTAGLDAVDVSTSIVFRCTAPIDQRSIAFQQPDAEQSGWRPQEPNILVLRDSIARNTDRTQWIRYAVRGMLAIEDDRILRFSPGKLLPNTSYRVIAQNIIAQVHHGTQYCEKVEYTFTTAYQVPHVAATTLDSTTVLRCNQPITIQFTSPLPPQASGPSFIQIEERNNGPEWTRRTVQYTMNSNRTVVSITPTHQWSAGNPIRLTCTLERITGDPLSNRSLVGVVRGASRVNLHVLDAEGGEVPTDVSAAISADATCITGAPFRAVAPSGLPREWRFVRWQCEEFPQIHNSTLPSIDVTPDCSLLSREITLIAIVEKTPRLSVPITVTGEGFVEVFDELGALLAHVDAQDTLYVSASAKELTFVATPTNGSVFQQWTSAHAAVAGLTSPTVVLPTTGAVMNPPIGISLTPVAGPYINPNFGKPTAPAGDRYRLEAFIADTDPDPMFRPTDGVHFTTPREFEDLLPETRTVCVRADRCWEIAGYHDPSVGPPVWFDEGRDELCVTSKLLSPVNYLVIFARRKRIDVRVERVLLASEDPRNVLVGRKPHPDSRIDVERRVVIAGQDTWVPLSAVACTVSGTDYSRYALKCGDDIRFRIRSAIKRGEEWRWFTPKNRYALPALQSSNRTGSIYTMVVDLDVAEFIATTCGGVSIGIPEIRVEGAFRQLFAVSEIGLRVRVNARGPRSEAKFEERWFDPLTYYDVAPDEPRSGRQLEYIARKGTSVKVKFTMPVDGPSILAGSLSADVADNILVTDPHAVNLDCFVRSGPNGNINFLSSTGQSADIAEFFICDPTTKPIAQALHGGIVDVTCGTGTKSFTGEPLPNAQMFVLRRMELPGFGLRLREADIRYDGDWDIWPFEMNGEVYHAMYGANLAEERALLTDFGFARIPDCGEQQGAQGNCTISYNDKKRPLSFGDRAVWLQTAWMGETDLAWWRMSTWDEDCKSTSNCLVNRIRDVINNVRTRADSYGSNEGGKKLEWGRILPDLIKTGADAIAALLPADEQDDFLGEGTFLEDFGTLWGMRTARSPLIDVHHENITYRLRGQWFVSRSVVR